MQDLQQGYTWEHTVHILWQRGNVSCNKGMWNGQSTSIWWRIICLDIFFTCGDCDVAYRQRNGFCRRVARLCGSGTHTLSFPRGAPYFRGILLVFAGEPQRISIIRVRRGGGRGDPTKLLQVTAKWKKHHRLIAVSVLLSNCSLFLVPKCTLTTPFPLLSPPAVAREDLGRVCRSYAAIPQAPVRNITLRAHSSHNRAVKSVFWHEHVYVRSMVLPLFTRFLGIGLALISKIMLFIYLECSNFRLGGRAGLQLY